jgi:mannosylglycerate hydrolase
MTEKRYTCYIVFQTHWDREWYLPFEVFRYRLIQVLERIVDGLEKGELKQFVLDGQMAALEDYFEVCEDEMKERVEALIAQGKIIIGPWYVLADEFLVSGESLIRNMEIGLKLARSLGEPQKIGYLPDTFGHVSQMPQILAEFGIDNAILWRGIQSETSELYWEGADGTRIFTVFLPEGYYQPVLNEEDVQTHMKSYVEKVKPYATTSKLLLTNGGDHLMPKFGNMSETINELNQQLDDVEFVESHYEEFVAEVRKEANEDLFTHVGEMRSNHHCYVLPNVLSTRTYLKRQNQLIEDGLTGYVEPLLALSGKNPARYLEDTWKLLLKNHPHDSICGCSIDEVHREMEMRTLLLEQRLEVLEKDALRGIGAFDPAMSGAGGRKPFEDFSHFTVFNPHPHPYSGWVTGEIWLHEGEEESFSLRDETGRVYQPTIFSKKKDRYFESPLDAFPDFKSAVYYEIGFYVERLSGLSLTPFEVVGGSGDELVKSASRTIENETLAVTLAEDGTLTLLDKLKNVSYHGLQQYYSSLDAGDEYNYSPPVEDVVSFARLVDSPVVEKAKGVEVLRYQLELELPSELNAERTGPAVDKVVTTIKVELRLFAGANAVETKITVDNQAKDQRLRMKYPLGSVITHTYSDMAFDVVKREAKKLEQFDVPKQKEVPVVVEPSYSFVRANEGEKGLLFYQRGLQEYQVTGDAAEDVLEVTVVRSVGWLSRDDFRTRGGGAGPQMETPEGQCIGTYPFEFAFGPYADSANSDIAREAQLFRVPPKILPGKLAKGTGSLLEVANSSVRWSAIRQVKGGLLVRLWNPTEQPQTVTFTSDRGIQKVARVTFDFQPVYEVEDLTDVLRPKAIATYLVESGDSSCNVH